MKLKKLEVDDDGDTSLHFAAKSGNIRLITTYVTFGVDVNITDYYGWTPLMFAAKNGQLKSVRTLVYLGANLSQRNTYGYCSLCLAASTGNLEIIKYLLKKKLKKGETLTEIQKPISPLMIAMLYGHLDAIKFFINEKFKLDAPSDFEGITPMYIASVLGNKDVLNLLKNVGYNIPIKLKLQDDVTLKRKSSVKCLFQMPENELNIPKIQIDSPLPDSPIFFTHSPALKLRKQSKNCDTLEKFLFEKTDAKTNRSKSACIPPNYENKQMSDNEDDDDVFHNSLRESDINYKQWGTDNKDFVKMLRNNSLDSYMSVFQKHEIDLDVFVTLTDKDLFEIGVKSKKRTQMLHLGSQLRNQGYEFTMPSFY